MQIIPAAAIGSSVNRIATVNTTGLSFETAGSERARIDTSGRLLVGTTTTSSTATIIAQGSNGGAAAPGVFRACHKTTPANDELFAYYLFGDSTHCDAAYIAAARDGGTWTSGTSHPTRLVFSTTADGGSSPTPRMTINNAGSVSISTVGAKLDLLSSGTTSRLGGKVFVLVTIQLIMPLCLLMGILTLIACTLISIQALPLPQLSEPD